MMTQTHFDAETHTYTIDGVRVPSITQILSDVGLIDSRWFNDEARNRGTFVAVLTELYDKGDIVVADTLDTLPTDLIGYLDAWKRFREDLPFDLDAIEQPCYSEVCHYGGTPDRVVHLAGEDTKTIIEIKTGSAAPWHSLQTAAQMQLVPGATGRMAVYLKPNGHYRVEHHDAFAADWTVFQAALHVWHWRTATNGRNG